MNKIKAENRKLVEDAKLKIVNLTKRQDEIFDELIRDLDIQDEDTLNWVFDFIYNAGDISNAYYKMVEDTIFEQTENLV
jgi:hypothetical protein